MPNAGGLLQQRQGHIKRLVRIYSARAKHEKESLDKPDRSAALERKEAQANREDLQII